MELSCCAVAAPSPWVTRFASIVPSGEVLDLACGSGRHTQLFLELGYSVVAVDRDTSALRQWAPAQPQRLTIMEYDLENTLSATSASQSKSPVFGTTIATNVDWPFSEHRFEAIVVTNYLYRPLLEVMMRSLAPGGILIYETFANGNARFGKPSNPNFLLASGELLTLAANPVNALRVIAFEEGYIDTPAPAIVQRLCAVRTISSESNVGNYKI
jgi:SAM-dependent methyltransferase